jgi:G3E family GTPase
MNWIGGWSQAGGSCTFEAAGTWWVTAPEQYWPRDKESIARIKENFQEPFGDRRQEIVIIGMNMDKEGLTKMLDTCLLTDAEMQLGPDEWAKYSDPFDGAIG